MQLLRACNKSSPLSVVCSIFPYRMNPSKYVYSVMVMREQAGNKCGSTCYSLQILSSLFFKKVHSTSCGTLETQQELEIWISSLIEHSAGVSEAQKLAVLTLTPRSF